MTEAEKAEAIHIARLNADVFKASRPEVGSCYLQLAYALEQDTLPTADILRVVINHLSGYVNIKQGIGELGSGLMMQKQQKYSQILLTIIVKELRRLQHAGRAPQEAQNVQETEDL